MNAVDALQQPAAYYECDLEQAEAHRFIHGQAAAFTRRAPDKTSANEDATVLIPIDDVSAVLLVADGLGGQATGATASRMAAQSLITSLRRVAHEDLSLREAILDGIERANNQVCELGTGAATTLSVVEIQNGEVRTYHVGDSLILLTGQRGKVKLQAVAHSPVGYAVESGMLDQDEAVHHEERNLVSNVIGAPDMRIELGPSVKMAPKDTLLVSSDGLADNLYLDEIVDRVRKGALLDCAQRLAQDCQARMHTAVPGQPSHADDLSFILYRRH